MDYLPEALARTCSSRSTRALVRVCLTDRVNLKGVHTNTRIINFQFAVPSINNENDAVH